MPISQNFVFGHMTFFKESFSNVKARQNWGFWNGFAARRISNFELCGTKIDEYTLRKWDTKELEQDVLYSIHRHKEYFMQREHQVPVYELGSEPSF